MHTNKSLNSIFLNAVKKWPNRPALTYNGVSWDYQTLYTKVLQFAVLIQQETQSSIIDSGCIAIWGEKTLLSVSAILATLLSGKTYTCLDLTLPASRIQYIFDLVKPKLLLLTEQSMFVQQQLKELINRPLTKDLTQADSNEYALNIDPYQNNFDFSERIAYLLFTSGSTGTPKGVCVSHRAATAAIDMFFEHIHLKQTDVIANQSALCYDLSMFDLFTSFSVGACVHLIPPHVMKVPKRFVNYVCENNLSSLFIVSSTLEYLLKYTLSEEYQLPLKKLLLTGEPISENLISLVRGRLTPDAEIWNLYSATEMPYAFAQRIQTDFTAQSLKSFNQYGSQIKFALRNPTTDEHNQDVGELYVESPVNFSGYLVPGNDLEHVERFPINQYFTGDLAKITTLGIELFGRLDRQIKILGNRVELDDIEICLESMSIIREAVIKFDKDTQKIIAFISLQNIEDCKVQRKNEIVKFCQKSLPAIMHPHEFIFVEKIPRTVSGKKNRKALIM